MGIYLNPGNAAFSEAVHSQIYVDKTELISYTNNVLATNQKNICVSRPRRFGKSITANMLAAYYSKGFTGDKISIDYTQKRYINKPKGAKPGFVTYINEKNILVIKPERV